MPINDSHKFDSNGYTVEFYIYHPETISLFNVDNMLAFSLSNTKYESNHYRKWYSSSAFDFHIINFLDKIPLRLGVSFGISSNIGLDNSFTFKSSILYELEFKPVDLVFELKYNKCINLKDDDEITGNMLDYITLNIKLAKKIQLN